MDLISIQGTEKLKRLFYPRDMVTHTGEREICAVSRSLSDNLRELARMINIF